MDSQKSRPIFQRAFYGGWRQHRCPRWRGPACPSFLAKNEPRMVLSLDFAAVEVEENVSHPPVFTGNLPIKVHQISDYSKINVTFWSNQSSYMVLDRY